MDSGHDSRYYWEWLEYVLEHEVRLFVSQVESSITLLIHFAGIQR